MPVLDSIPAWLSASPSAAAAAELLPRQGEVAAQPPEGAPASSPDSPTESPSSSSASSSASSGSSPSLPFTSDIRHPTSDIASSPFPDCDPLSDTLLAKIAAGTECLAAIAAFHHIPYPRFTLWLLQPATQERLAALSVAIASAARLTATAALPDIVRGLKSTVDQLQSQTHMTIAPPGANHLVAESIILRRHRALIAAASLIYRISRFTCPSPSNQRTDVPPRSALGSRCSSREREHPAAPRRGLAPLPRIDLPTIDFADLDSRPERNATAASELLPRQGEVSPKATEGAPVFSTDSSRLTPSPPSESRIPSVFSVSSVVQLESEASDRSIPTSDINVEDALRILTAEYDLSPAEVAELRGDSHSWVRDFIPPAAAAKPAARRSRADDG